MKIKIPSNLDVPIKTQRAYSAYLWLKCIASNEGVIKKGDIKAKDRHKVRYWSKKLISHGWMKDHGKSYSLRAYQFVWARIGVKRVNKCKGHIGYHYIKVDITFNEKKNPLQQILTEIQYHLVERKKRQIINRLKVRNSLSTERVKQTQKPLFSALAAAKTLGYSSSASGHKYREKYFDVIRVEGKITRGYDFKTDSLRLKSPCFRIDLRTIFHDA